MGAYHGSAVIAVHLWGGMSKATTWTITDLMMKTHTVTGMQADAFNTNTRSTYVRKTCTLLIQHTRQCNSNTCACVTSNSIVPELRNSCSKKI